MKKRAFGMVMLAVLLMVMPAWAESPRLPDIGPLLEVEGESLGTTEGTDGIYHVYAYEKEMTVGEAVDIMGAYEVAAEWVGFTATDLDDSQTVNMLDCKGFAYGAKQAEVAIGIMSGADSLSNGGKGLLRFVLCVPEGMDFVLGEYVSFSK